MKGISLEARKITLFEESSNVTGIPGILSYLSKGLGQVLEAMLSDA